MHFSTITSAAVVLAGFAAAAPRASQITDASADANANAEVVSSGGSRRPSYGGSVVSASASAFASVSVVIDQQTVVCHVPRYFSLPIFAFYHQYCDPVDIDVSASASASASVSTFQVHQPGYACQLVTTEAAAEAAASAKTVTNSGNTLTITSADAQAAVDAKVQSIQCGPQ